MEKITVKDILFKHTRGSIEGEQAFEFCEEELKAADKEIVEKVIDKCKEEAISKFVDYDEAIVDDYSILKVKYMIDYE